MIWRGRSIAWLGGAAVVALGDPAAALAQPVSAPVNPSTTVAASQRLNTTGRTIDLVVPLRERVPLGQVAVRIAPDDSVTVSKADLAAALGRITTPEFRQSIERLPASDDGFVALDGLSAGGVRLRFDPQALDLAVEVDTAARPERTLDLGLNSDAQPPLPDGSDAFSALLAYQGSWDWVQRGQDPGLRRPIANFEFNGRLFNLVSFQNQFGYDGNVAPAFTRFATRFFHDRPNSMLRFSAGDLFSVPLVFQDQAEIAGVGVSRLLREFRPDRVFTSTAGQRITLNQAATVTILLNGAPARTLDLGPGTYDLRDLPLTSGANRVDLLVEDAAGGRRVVSFDFFQDTSLLAPGVVEYDAKLGIRSDFDDGVRRYFRREGIATGFLRRGLTEQFTAGVNFQGVRDRQQAGIEGVWGTPIGLFSADASVSRLKGFGAGYAARIQYRHSTPLQQLAGARRFDLLAEYRSEDFGGVETLVPSNGTALSLVGRYDQPVSRRLSLGIGADYRLGRNDLPNRYALRGSATYSIGTGLQFNASAGWERFGGFNVGATMFWRFSRNSLVAAQYDSRTRDARVGYYHSPDRLLDTLAWNVETSRVAGALGFNGAAVYRSNRGDLELAHRAVVSGLDGAARSNVTSLRARGALAFSGGRFAAGRYLNDSFAIVAGHPSLKGARVYIGSGVTDRAEARTGALGPALVPMSSYSRRAIYYQVPEAPDGYDIGAGSDELYPWLHSGRRVTVGSAYNVTIYGRLLDQEGDPLPLIAGTARRVDAAGAPSVSIFTNRQGRIGASGLSPGKWQIRAGNLLYDVTIRTDQGALVDVADLRPATSRDMP